MDFIILVKRGQDTYLMPKRVIPPEELPKLLAFLRERIAAFESLPQPVVPAPPGTAIAE